MARLLACRPKIISSANLKLIISVLILILFLPSFKSLSLVAPTRHTALNLACLLEVGQQAWCTISKFTNQEGPTSSSNKLKCQGQILTFRKPSTSISLAESPLGVPRARNAVEIFSFKETEKLLLTSYVGGPLSNSSSMKGCVLHSSDLSSQRQICYKGYVR